MLHRCAGLRRVGIRGESVLLEEADEVGQAVGVGIDRADRLQVAHGQRPRDVVERCRCLINVVLQLLRVHQPRRVGRGDDEERIDVTLEDAVDRLASCHVVEPAHGDRRGRPHGGRGELGPAGERAVGVGREQGDRAAAGGLGSYRHDIHAVQCCGGLDDLAHVGERRDRARGSDGSDLLVRDGRTGRGKVDAAAVHADVVEEPALFCVIAAVDTVEDETDLDRSAGVATEIDLESVKAAGRRRPVDDGDGRTVASDALLVRRQRRRRPRAAPVGRDDDGSLVIAGGPLGLQPRHRRQRDLCPWREHAEIHGGGRPATDAGALVIGAVPERQRVAAAIGSPPLGEFPEVRQGGARRGDVLDHEAVEAAARGAAEVGLQLRPLVEIGQAARVDRLPPPIAPDDVDRGAALLGDPEFGRLVSVEVAKRGEQVIGRLRHTAGQLDLHVGGASGAAGRGLHPAIALLLRRAGRRA